MKNSIYITLICFLLGATVNAQLFNPQTKEITETFFPDSDAIVESTPALKKKRGYTNYKELVDFINNLKEKHNKKVSITYIGKSQKGKDIPMVKLNLPNGKEKIKVFMQGGLHGDESASTETMLYLMDRLLNDTAYSNLLDHVELAIIPMANIDGFLKNKRSAANGLDLNRDQTKLIAPESIVLKQAFSDFAPHVAIDFHEYRPYRRDFARMGKFGVTNAFDAMFLYSGNLNIPKNIRDLTKNLFVDNASAVLDENNYTNHPYISSRKVFGEIHINQGSISSRSSATNFALSNAISSLIEIRGVALGKASFKRRIHTGFLIAISYLKTASENMKLVKNEITKATNQTNDVVVTYERDVYKNDIKFIDISDVAYVNKEMTIRDAWKAKPILTRPRPKAYIIDANQTEVIEKLKILGVEMEILNDSKTFQVNAYKVKSHNKATYKYEKRNIQVVETDLVKKEVTFNKGSAIVMMNQKRANIIPEVLEPEATNSFVSFSIIKAKTESILPIYRLLN